jgi:hypothetical protein
MKRCTVVPTVAELRIDSSPDRWDAVPTSPRKRLHNPAAKGGSSSPVFLWDKEEPGKFPFDFHFFDQALFVLVIA